MFFFDFIGDWKTRTTRENSIGEGIPWWKKLPDIDNVTPDDIIKLYSAEAFASLHLSGWQSEGAGNTPACFFAYNIARAYSKLNKADKSLQWLAISFRIDKFLTISAMYDDGFEYLKKYHKDKFNSCINKYK